jgi:3-oxoacyl-[acyl-carrier protein] reductase
VLDVYAASKSVLSGTRALARELGPMGITVKPGAAGPTFDAQLNVNVREPTVVSKAALALLTKGGRIISIGSYFADRVPAPVLGVYAATKSALGCFTKALARELGPKGVTVNMVQPGSIDTDMNPNAVVFLAGEKAGYVTGATLTVDGGANA